MIGFGVCRKYRRDICGKGRENVIKRIIAIRAFELRKKKMKLDGNKERKEAFQRVEILKTGFCWSKDIKLKH